MGNINRKYIGGTSPTDTEISFNIISPSDDISFMLNRLQWKVIESHNDIHTIIAFEECSSKKIKYTVRVKCIKGFIYLLNHTKKNI